MYCWSFNWLLILYLPTVCDVNQMSSLNKRFEFSSFGARWATQCYPGASDKLFVSLSGGCVLFLVTQLCVRFPQAVDLGFRNTFLTSLRELFENWIAEKPTPLLDTYPPFVIVNSLANGKETELSCSNTDCMYASVITPSSRSTRHIRRDHTVSHTTYEQRPLYIYFFTQGGVLSE